MAEPVVEIVSGAAATAATPTITVPASASAEVVKAVIEGHVEAAQATSQAIATQSLQFQFMGYNFNLLAVLIGVIMVGILWMFWHIQRTEKLDFADMITKDGRSVSLTKVLQLLGGVTATWVMIKLTLTNSLSESLFGIYLTYVGAIEGYSKYVAAKYGYQETGVRDGGAGVGEENHGGSNDPDGSAQKIIKAAVQSASDAEQSARDAKVQAKNAAIDLQETKDK